MLAKREGEWGRSQAEVLRKRVPAEGAVWMDPVCLTGSKPAGVAVAAWVGGTGTGDEVGAVAGLLVREMLGYSRSSDVHVSDTGGRWRLLSSGGARSYLCCVVGLFWLLCCHRLLGY